MVEYLHVQPIEEIMKQSEFLRWLKGVPAYRLNAEQRLGVEAVASKLGLV